jgi:cell division protein ZapA
MGTKGTTVIEVEIFGGVYSVRGDLDRDYLQEVASLVDEKMRLIAERVSTVDTGKIAILAAMNLADELIQCQEKQEGVRVQISERVEDLANRLANALQETTD